MIMWQNEKNRVKQQKNINFNSVERRSIHSLLTLSYKYTELRKMVKFNKPLVI